MTTLRTARTRAAGALTAITMTALLAACSAGSSDDGGAGTSAASGGSTRSDVGQADSAGSAKAPSAGREAGDRSSGALDSGATGSASGSDSASGSGDGPTTPEMQRAIISSGSISLSSKDVGETRREVQRIVDAQGGDITEENTETDDKGTTAYVRLVIRVPSSKFSASMEALEEAGALRSSSRGSDDVTTQVIDNGVRVRAQEASLKRVELLLANAKDLKDIIWIESQLTNRQAELDSLKSQQSWLEDQTSLSTITVDISDDPGAVQEGPDDDQPAGFLSGLSGGMKAMGAMLVAVTTILGALLPFAAVALVVGLPAWLVVRRRRKAPQAQPPTA